jgi:hypothetical protein
VGGLAGLGTVLLAKPVRLQPRLPVHPRGAFHYLSRGAAIYLTAASRSGSTRSSGFAAAIAVLTSRGDHAKALTGWAPAGTVVSAFLVLTCRRPAVGRDGHQPAAARHIRL